jgi:hypothetical protein
MYIDNLTIAGVLIVSAYALLPLLFGREFFRVEDDEADTGSLQAGPLRGPRRAGTETPHPDQRSPCAGT